MIQSKSELPSIYAYNDFRLFLRDYQIQRQKIDRTFTKAKLVKLLHLPNTRSYFNDVLKGKYVSGSFVERFTAALELAPDEAQFFRILVKFNQSESPEEKELYFEQLIALNKIPKYTLDVRLLQYYSRWYNPAVRALLEIIDFNGRNFSAITQKISPKISIDQARESFQLLCDLELIVQNDDGFFKPAQKAIEAPENVRDDLLRQYQGQLIAHAHSSLLKPAGPNGTASTNMLSVSQQGYEKLLKITERYRSQVRNIVHNDEQKPTKLMHLHVFFLSLLDD